MAAPTTIEPLSWPEWRAREAAHRARARAHTLPAKQRRDRGQAHPIVDFLFEYYPYSFAFLEHWKPGIGFELEWRGDVLKPPYADRWHVLDQGVMRADPRKLTEKERARLSWIAGLLEATADRAPNFACHGLHEWAMVYRGGEVRHERTLKLRLPQEEIDSVVEGRPICCSHHDAFRFFAPEARAFNRVQPDYDSRVLLEQPGCLHANMDLYKWAAKAMPWVGSDLLLDCFELAVSLRELDMRASPYDVSGYGLDAVPIETAEGRRVYEMEQRRLAERASPLRKRLVFLIRGTLEEAARFESR